MMYVKYLIQSDLGAGVGIRVGPRVLSFTEGLQNLFNDNSGEAKLLVYQLEILKYYLTNKQYKYKIKYMNQKGLAPLIIILGVVALVMMGFLIGKLIKPSTEQVPTLSDSVPASPTPTVSATLSPAFSPIPTKTAKPTPIPTVAAVPPYQLEARLVCARADEGYADDNHVDLIYQVTVNGKAIPFATLTLTDNKTKDVFDFANGGPPGNSTITSWGGTLHWKLRDRDNKEMTFTADGRDYTLKLYKLTTVSEAVTQDLQPVAQKTFSKICEF